MTGRNFPPNDVATIHVNGVQLGTVPTGSAGGFVVLLNTEVADPGRYSVTATVNPEGYTIFLLDSDAPTWPSEGGGPLVQVPPGIALADIIYLPLIRR
ncbi:MAG: hypothetical protein MAG451_00259 [Anaerolineales bacterium]|nr:hypothetical protein [Anaerolineales bacterium]